MNPLTDQQLASAEAEMFESFNEFEKLFGRVSDSLYTIVMSTETSKEVNSLIASLKHLHSALGNLVDAYEIVADVKGVDLNAGTLGD